MSTNKLMGVTAVAALLGLAGTASADYFASIGSGNWGDAGTWLQGSDPDNLDTAVRAPTTGDFVEISSGDTVTVAANADATRLTVDASGTVSVTHTLTLHGDGSTTILTADVSGTVDVSSGSVVLTGTAPLMSVRSGANLSFSGTNPSFTEPNDGVVSILSGGHMPVTAVATITVSSGGNFDINQGADTKLSGTAPGLILNGVVTLDGYCELTSSSGTAYVDVQPTQPFPNSTTGNIKGLVGAAAQPEIRMNTTSAAVTLTNNGLIEGRLTIKKGSGANNASFINHYHVYADAAASLIFDSSLASVSDNTSNAVWQVSNSGSAVLQFDRGSATFSGTFNMLISGGNLNINDTISASSPSDPLVYDYGCINVASGKNFYFTGGGGTCGTQPTSPLSNTSFCNCP